MKDSNLNKRQKFATTLNIYTIQHLEEIKVYLNKTNKKSKRLRGLNEVIEEIVEQKWGKMNNDKHIKER